MFPRTLILATAAGVLLAACSNGSSGSGSTNIANGGIVVSGDQVVLHGNGGIEGNLDATGNLVIDGRTVAVDAGQREQLQQYYQGAHAVREHGIATGKAGAAVAVQSLKSAAAHVVGGDGARADATLDDATSRVDREASKICFDLQRIRAAQGRLATGLAAFKPFATIVDGDEDDDCSTTFAWHDSGRALALKSGNGEGVRVTRAAPASVWGLRQGDVILAVDGQPVDQVEQLLKRLQASRPEPVAIRVRRDGTEQDITVAGRDYANLADSQAAATPSK
jgi:PDZ domain